MESNKIFCPHCGSHNCFHEQSESGASYLCMSCGYTSNDLFKADSEQLAGYETTMPELYKDIKFVDQERSIVWYPTVLNVPTIGLVFVDGTTKENWVWRAAPAVDVAEQDREKYPIPGQSGAFYTKRVDMELAKTFTQTEFTAACKYIGLIREGE